MSDDMDVSYNNRELSWLEFNARVLDQAGDSGVPLLDRLKFAAIFSSNLDEFFMVRVAGLRQQIESGSSGTDPSGLRAEEQVARITKRVATLVQRQHRYINSDIMPALARKGLELTHPAQLNNAERKQLTRYFRNEVLPVLTPVAVDPSHPFPIVANGATEIALKLQATDADQGVYALVEVPSVLPNFVEIHRTHEKNDTSSRRAHVLLEDVILDNLTTLFHGCTILETVQFRVLRDMDFDVDREVVADLLLHLEEQLRRRRRRLPIRLEIQQGCSRRMAEWLIEQFDIEPQYVARVPAPLDPTRFFEIIDREQRPGLVEPPWPPLDVPAVAEDRPVFESVRAHGLIPLFHPYESFYPVVRFLEEAANDPQVLAIKQTLYRVSGDSPVVRALQKAAENGKQVTVIVEVKARFDEERNISWAKRLEESGAHVIYGIVGLKIHCKALLVIRREEGRITRYLHLSTGNYNDTTARIYTDIGMFVTDPDMIADVAALFNVMTGYAEPPQWQRLAVAPFNLREHCLKMIDREIRQTTPHRAGRIITKLNSLVDPEIIRKLYEAANAGVKIDLIVRGICCLDPTNGNENIRVVSIVDRYLEHSRIYYFDNNGTPEYYLSSADWMPRNLNRRIEIMWPVDDEQAQALLFSILNLHLNDNRKGRFLKDGLRYNRLTQTHASSRSQQRIYQMFEERCAQLDTEATEGQHFQVISP